MQVSNQSLNSFIKKGIKVPDPPKRGELMVCQICGKHILPEQFSKDERQRKREFKWHIHSSCYEKTQNYIDKCVPGLERERNI